jgi:hypothetical protein
MVAILLSLVSISTSAEAQQAEPQPLFDQLVQTFRTRALRIGMFLQALGDFQEDRDATEGNSGFTLPRARVSLRGELDRRISYAIEADLARSPAVNDAWIRVTLDPAFAIDMGQFKTAFSGERLQSSSTLEFINRSQIVRALAPGRQVGVQVRGQLSGIGMGYMLGAFNGNAPRSLTNDNDAFLVAGRWTLRVDPFGTDATSDGIEIGVNGVRSRDEAASLGYSLGSTFRGLRTLVGADVRAEHGPVLLTGEYIRGRLEDADTDITTRPFGWQASLTLRVADQHRIHGRWDTIHGDGRRSDRDLGILGWSYDVSTPVRFMVNYVFPSGEGFERHQLLTQMQLVF